jgi:hypothetical protein
MHESYSHRRPHKGKHAATLSPASYYPHPPKAKKLGYERKDHIAGSRATMTQIGFKLEKMS